MNRLFRTLSMAMLSVAVIQVPVYAGEINLSSLSGDGSQSHEHLYESRYNDESHWQECCLCKDIKNKSNHSKSTKYSVSSSSCSEANIKIVSCTSCEYYFEGANGNPHTYGGMVQSYWDDGVIMFCKACTKCSAGYEYSTDGYKYYYDSARTKEIDIETFSGPCYIYDSYGNMAYISSWYEVLETDSELIDFEYYFPSNNVMNLTAEFKVPEYFRDMYTPDQLNNNSILYVKFGTTWFAKGYEGAGYEHSYSSRTYDSSTGILKVTSSVNIRDYTKDWSTPGRTGVHCIFNISHNGGTKMYRYLYVKLPTSNFIDPVITSAE